MDPERFSNLVELVEARARTHSGQRAFTFLSDGETEDRQLSYGELGALSRALGARLARAAKAGERVLLLLPPGPEFVIGFCGCLWAGMIAVPAYPPGSRRSLPRLRALVADSRPALGLTLAAHLDRYQSLATRVPELAALRWLEVDRVGDSPPERRIPPPPSGDPVAFLQYTSGSTAVPKGVMVSHRNLLHNQEAIRRATGLGEGDRVAGWLPLYHDMGLIGNVFQPLYLGIPCVLMPPLAFLKKPVRWLQAISRYRATTSAAPNFAYAMCVDRVSAAERAELDLSCWRVALNGAEPIRAETLERFARTFAPCGFRAEAFFPCYGLAEATLLVTGSDPQRPPPTLTLAEEELERGRVRRAALGPRRRTLVSCGRPAADQRLVVVDPESARPLAPGNVGEIRIAGPSVARGYWNRPQETERIFGARLDGGGEQRFLRTGDLGFVDEGELYVTGRLKDLIILRGRNLYPQDLEWTAESSHPALRPGAGAAFPVEAGGEERLVVVHEIERRRQAEARAAAEAVLRAVAREHEARVHEVVLIRHGSIPKTSSGKIRRRDCRAGYLAGELPVVLRHAAAAAPEERTEALGLDRDGLLALSSERRPAAVEAEIARGMGISDPALTAEEPLAGLGLDSLAAVELAHRLETDLGISLPVARLLAETTTLRSLAAEVVRQLPGGEPPAVVPELPLPAPGSEGEDHPLSAGQRALWFLARLAPESPAYNVVAAARVRTGLDPAALGRALATLVARHPALRFTFHAVAGEPLQRLGPAGESVAGVRRVVASGWSTARVREFLAAEACRPFDLERGPLLRLTVLERPAGERLVVLAVHHLVADFWSLAVLVRELGIFYARETGGEPAPPRSPEALYTDWVRWQEARCAGPEGERLWRYWRDRLAGVPQVLELPTDRPRRPAPSEVGGRVFARLDRERSDAVRAFARASGATLFATLLAAFQSLLARLTGELRLAVGTPAAPRRPAQVESVVGYFVNPLVMAADFHGGPTFRQALVQVRRTAVEAFAHQEFPFPLLAERLQPRRPPGRSPLFQVMFVLQKAHLPGSEELAAFALGWPGVELELGGVVLESLPLEQRGAPFELTLMAAEWGERLGLGLQFARDLFDPTTARRLLGHFTAWLQEITSHPDRRLDGLGLLRPAERAQLVNEWNDTRLTEPASGCLHELFAAQVACTPDAVAVVDPESRRILTYAALAAGARGVAQRLRTAAPGIGPEVRVGLCAERSPEMVMALLGILEAGGAWVPLDPSYPRARLAWLRADSGVRVILTQSHLRPLVDGGGATVVGLDDPGAGAEIAPRPGPPAAGHPDQLAYVIYTSGSTGRPKGAMNAHRGVVNRLLWMKRTYALSPDDRVLHKSPLGFDVSVWELFWPLLSGARVVLARPGGERDPAYLMEVIAGEGITAAAFVPSLLRILLDAPGVKRRTRLRHVVASGEALTPELRDGFSERFSAALHNLYGPSETAISVTFWDCPQPAPPGPVPIGRPMSDIRVHVLDRRLELVPLGVVGELVIAGVAVGRGYLGHPGMSAERFVPDPLSGTPGGRLYRTGDRARRCGDGSVEFLGRLDHQVKLRGLRIEPGEIETVLAGHPALTAAAVVSRTATGGEAQLMAFVAVQEGAAVSAAELRAHLTRQLPEAMVPRSYVELASLPLTPNGKVDRRTLLTLEGRSLDSEDRRAPRTPVEELLAGIWSEVLRLPRPHDIDAEADFFALGGHSLRAAQVVARIRDTLGPELPLRALFEAPTVAALAARIEAARRATPAPAAPEIVRRPRAEHTLELPLSFAQQRLWFLEQMEPGSARYHIPAALWLDGELDRAALRRAGAEIVRRHEVLRTTYRARDGWPVQVIAPRPQGGSALPLVVELARLGPEEREAEARRLLAREAVRPFALAAEPPLRSALIRLDARRHALGIVFHHIAADGWSMGVVMRELRALYGAYREGRRSPLAEPAIQYADFARWQRETLRGEVLEAQLAYWRKRLAGARPLELPTDRPRPAVRSPRGAVHSFFLPEELLTTLRRAGRAHGATLFMTLLAAFQGLLYRLTGQKDLSVGIPVANRDQARIEELIGFFVNTLVLRLDLTAGTEVRAATFAALLPRVREGVLEAHAHRDLPFERLVEALGVKRDPDRTPLFQVMFAERPAVLGELGLPGLKLRPEALATGTAKFDLTLVVDPGEEGLAGELEYATDLFDPTTIARWAGYWATLLRAVAAEPRRRFAELPLWNPAERHQLLVEWSTAGGTGYDPEWEGELGGRGRPLAREGGREGRERGSRGEGSGRGAAEFRGVHQLFADQAARTPEAVALVSGDRHLSYRELDRQAAALALRLKRCGVAPEVRAAICAERSPEAIWGFLGVLKAGGAYIPLDPTYPHKRLAFLLEDARVAVVLTRERLLPTLRELLPEPGPQLVALDSVTPGPEGDGAARKASGGPDHLAYVIYTSGSTGRPKGVEITHAALLNLVLWFRREYAIRPGQRTTQLGSLAFDVSVGELWPPLTAGASVHLPGEEVREAPERLVAWLAERAITVSALSTSLAEAVLSEPWPRNVALETLLSGGDRLRRRPPRGLSFALVNNYGPTENTVVSTFAPVPADAGPGAPPIGRAVDGVRTYAVDAEGRPVPMGIAGELLLGGRSLGRGYLARPALTAERFLPDPFSTSPGERLYRTGDLVRTRADGSLDFLGRIDSQVQVRGFRVELGEIEATLVQHPGVRQAVAALAPAAQGSEALVAFWVAAHQPAPAAGELREFLAARLPQSMLPGLFVALDALPLTPNGKVDRAALPQPEAPRTDPGGPPSAPQTPAEELLAGIWTEVLGNEAVGRDDHFFELGGHSLLATQVISRIRKIFGVELPLRTLFEAPTVAELAGRIAAAQGVAMPSARPTRLSTPRASTTGGTHLSFAQERMWFLDRLDPGNTAFNVAGAVRLAGVPVPAALAAALEAVVRRHETLRTTFAEVAGRPVPKIHPPPAPELPLLDLTALPESAREQELRRRLDEESRTPFDLSAGPLVRVRLLRLAPAEHVLVLNLHHIIADGWSVGILIRELAAFYRAAIRRRPAPLAPLPLQYAEFAHWQRRWLEGEVLEAQLEYWKGQLGGSLPVLELPGDRPRPATQSFTGGQLSRRISPQLTGALRALGRSSGATLFMTLLAAFEVLLHRLSGGDDLLVGTPVAGRRWAETEGVIGCFLNTLVLRTDLAGDPTFDELLARVRETALQAFAHQDVPFERLIRELQPARDLIRTPVFQVFFNLLNLPREPMALPDLRLEPIVLAGAESKFDLTVYAEEQDGEIALRLVYNAALFDAARIAELLRQYEGLLAQVAARPGERIGRTSLLTPATRSQLSDPAAALLEPRFDAVSRAFVKRVEEGPQRLALAGERSWSYAGLLGRAATIRRLLEARGAEPGTVVAVIGPRQPELIAALLGILLARGVMLSLDRRLPAVRLRVMLRKARARYLLAIGGAVEDLDLGEAEEVVSLPVPIPLRPSPDPPPPRAEDPGPDDPAYVFFTSGTSGVPKGILGCQKGLSHFLDWQRRSFRIGPGDRVAHLTGLSFDPVLREIFLPLTSGATLCLPPGDGPGPQSLGWMAASGVSVLHTVPSLARTWLRQAVPDLRLPHLRVTFFAGEPLTGELVVRWRQALSPAAEVINLYGPTETTLAKCWYRVPPQPGPGVQPIGEALPQSQVLVLGPEAERCGIGEPGEIVIRTPFRTLGYLDAGDEDRLRFRPNPFTDDDPNDLLYFTGDRGRFHPSGRLEILGRLDDQIKVQGVRIEPAEIRAAILRQGGVEACEVLAWGDPPDERQLVAYLVPRSGDPVRGLRRRLREVLPEPMVPSAFVVLDALPLTPNGKVDRRALPAPAPPAQPDGAPEPPATPVEEVLAGFWGELLDLERVGRDDDFFELGGHSLLVTQLLARVREVFRVELPVRAVFEVPTLRELAQKLEALRSQSPELVTPPLRRAEDADPLPLSYAQERLWFLDQVEPGSSAYHLPGAYRLRGSLEVAALERSLAEILVRHEVLRTTFVWQDDRPVQRIAPPEPFALPVVDLGAAGSGAAAEWSRLSAREARRPFDLERDGMIRTLLLRLGPEEHVLVVVLHHIAADAWSRGIFLRELAALYEAFAAGGSWPLSRLPIRYADFARWQRQWLEGGSVLDQQLRFWRARLGTGEIVLELPTDRARPVVRTTAGATLPCAVDGELARGLLELSRRRGATLFMTLLAAFQTLLHRTTGQRRLAVGTPVAGRTRVETEGLIGFFANTLVLVTEAEADLRFDELVERVREEMLAAYAHQDLPFEKLVAELQPERRLSHSPLIQVLFVLQNAPVRPLRMSTITGEPLRLASGGAKFDLTVSLNEVDEGLAGTWEYNRDLFDATTVRRLQEHFRNLLRAAVDAPERPLARLTLLGAAARAQLVAGWNDTAAELPRGVLHQLFEEQADRTPEAVAVVFADRSLSYRELDRRANRLARRLRALGVGPEVPVGAGMERSPEMVVALLGIFKAGGAYVPLDPTYPAERLERMAADSELAVLLCDQQWPGKVRAADVKLELTERSGVLAGGSPERIGSGTDPDHLAYVIFTSGSTGRPKGVQISHRALVNLLDSMRRRPGLGRGDVLASVTTLSFDISALEIFLPLMVGARLVLAPREAAYDGARLAATLAACGATAMQATPTVWQLLLDALPEADGVPGALKALAGGEALPLPLARNLADRTAALWNLYGPTETTIWSAVEAVGPDASSVSIGRPIANTAIYLTDPRLELVPPGWTGEIAIGGSGLARGYRRQPGRTAESFLPDPFGARAGGRLYLTGDLARQLPDGTLRFLGRCDHQVKVRGHRVELGEIEAALTAHGDVREAVVRVVEAPAGGPRLVAYVVPRQAAGSPAAGGPTPEVLRRHLRGRLPAVMVPSDFVLLEDLPRTPNRKVDRRALPAPESSRRQVDTELVPPRTRAERRVAEIWQEVLGLEAIGTRDNFFDLGGHSLQLVQVHRRLERDFARTLSILDLFHHPTIRAQAAFLSAATPDEDTLGGVRTRARHQVDAIRQRRRRMRRIKSR